MTPYISELRDQIDRLERRNSELEKENERLREAYEKLQVEFHKLAFAHQCLKSNTAIHFEDVCQHDFQRIESTVPYMQCRKCYKRFDAYSVIPEPPKI